LSGDRHRAFGLFGGVEPLPGGYSFGGTNIVDMYLGCREAESTGDVVEPSVAASPDRRRR
jgi:hypothetical protein